MATRKPLPRVPEEKFPDPARSYERAKPEAETGMGRLDVDPTPTSKKPDRIGHAVGNKQASKQINADDVMNDSVKPKKK
jgi:hypothetical protein